VPYIVLARKYRPRNFAQMAGQDHVVRALTNALEQGRLHHAYLFTGTRGIGKTTVSRILAKSLNCVGPDGQGGVTAHPCGVCEACRAIDADRFVDYIELDAASNRSIDEIRDLIERAAYKPAVGRYKVFMIDEAHQLTRDAFNALLKTLEEPPEYLKFVLATTDPERMLPTVLSRCLQFNLRPMAPEVVQEHLARVLAAEAVPFDEGALRLLGRAARGSMRDALSLTDQAIAYGGGALDEAGVSAMLGAAGSSLVLGILRALAARDAPAVVAAAEALRSAGGSPASVLEQLAQRLQQLAVAQVLATADPDDAEFLELAPLFAPDELQLLYSLAVHGRGELSLVSDDHAGLLMILLRYLAFSEGRQAQDGGSGEAGSGAGRTLSAGGSAHSTSSVVPRAAPLRAPSPPAAAVAVAGAGADASWPSPVVRATAVEPAASARPTDPAALVAGARDEDPKALSALTAPAATVAPPTPSVPVAAPRVDADAARLLSERWDTLVRSVAAQGALSGLVRELAWQSTLVGVEDGQPPGWRLEVGHDSLRGAALAERLGELLEAHAGLRVRLQVEAGQPQDTPARRDAVERARRQIEADEAIRDDPVVLELLQQFRTARIVPGSVKPL
jgi:DNA polymerase-3 subunit gamma/tau